MVKPVDIATTGMHVLGTAARGTKNAVFSVFTFGGRTVKNFTLIGINKAAQGSSDKLFVTSIVTGLGTLIVAGCSQAQKQGNANPADALLILGVGGSITACLMVATLITKKIALSAHNSLNQSFFEQKSVQLEQKPLPLQLPKAPSAAPAA